MDRRIFPTSSGGFFSIGRLMDTWIFFLFVAVAVYDISNGCDGCNVYTAKDKCGKISVMLILQNMRTGEFCRALAVNAPSCASCYLRTEKIYHAHQINVPSAFPRMLKLYAKAAIRTQPCDLLRWTTAYFRALANDETPPMKDRLEYPPFTHISGITPRYLKTLLNRFGHMDKVSLKALVQEWRGLDLPETSLYRLFMIAGLSSDQKYCDFYRFLAIACGFLGNNLPETMIYVCELLTHEPEGGSAMIPLRTFLDLYGYLANLDCDGKRRYREVERDSDSSYDAVVSVLKLSSDTVDLTMRECSCELMADVKEANNTSEDVCEKVRREKPPSEDLGILKDYGEYPKGLGVVTASARQCVTGDKTEIETESIDRIPRGETSCYDESAMMTNVESPASIIDHIEYNDDASYENFSGRDAWKTADDVFEFNSDYKEEISEKEAAVNCETTIISIDLKSSSEEICRCLRESVDSQAPAKTDSLSEFLKRMQAEVEAGRLETIFRISGIGPPISSERVTAVGLWLTECARRQENLIGPRNIRHFLCPKLDDTLSECDCE